MSDKQRNDSPPPKLERSAAALVIQGAQAVGELGMAAAALKVAFSKGDGDSNQSQPPPSQPPPDAK